MANKLLKERLAENDYYKVPHTPRLSTHKTRPIWFALTADDFGVRCVGREHTEHPCWYSSNITRWRKAGKENYTAASPSKGTMKNFM